MEIRGQLLTSILQCAFYLSLFKAYSEGSLQSQYIGCFYDTSSEANWTVGIRNSSEMTIGNCIQTCNETRATYAVLQDGRDCLCGDVINASFPINTCQIPCSGNTAEVCGGSDETRDFSMIYTACPVGYYGAGCNQVCHCKQYMPCHRFSGKCPNGCESSWSGDTCNKEANVSYRYMGCYGDAAARAMGPQIDNGDKNTVELCTERCALRNYTYAGLQFESQCFCGESYSRYGTATNCDMRCTGNPEQFCGGSFANSVYSVCPKGSYGKDCIAQCNCQNSNICPYATGSCNTGCKPGWSGSSCNNRDCSRNNGFCSANETCVTVNLKFSSVTRCQCLSGFQRTRLWDNCTDINECDLDLCDGQTTTCNNTVGNFVCTCRIGYRPVNETFCEDINECLSSPCDNSTICSNTPGSFVCNCRPGFARSNNGSVCIGIIAEISDKGNAGTIAGAVVGSILGLALIVAIVFLVLYLYRRGRPEKLVNLNPESEELSRSSQETIFRDQDFSLYGVSPSAYEEIGPTTGNALNTLHNKLSDPDSIKQEFQSVDLQPKDFCALGTMAEVKKKNRFVNIIPYESNRVVLSRTTDDDTSRYINASYVQGYNNATKFIAAQGPRVETLEDFWRMIIENHVNLIVMITNLVENQKNKCEKYWPDLGHPVVYGDITVTLESEKSWPDYTIRCIRCFKKSEIVKIKQLHYLSWPDHGVPSDIKGFLTFRRIVRQRMKPDKYTVIHCSNVRGCCILEILRYSIGCLVHSAGAGRTGAFIAIDYLLEQEKVEHDVRILDCLKKLRDQRSQMIQNLAQYVFVHNALLLAFEIGDTVIPTTQFLSKYKQLQTKDAASGKSTLEKQFQFLEQVTVDPEETAKYRVWSNVVAQDIMDDMNAVFVQSWKLRDAYIATQPADHFTGLWELSREQSCSVIIYIDPNPGSKELFIPTKDNPKTVGDCTLLCESMIKEDFGSRYTIIELKEQEDTTYANVGSSDIYQNTGSTSAKTQVTVLHVTEFSDKRSWDANHLLSLYNVVNNLTSKKNKVPVMAVSSDCSLSGFCLAAFNAFEMMKQEEMIDIYQIVLNIRKSKLELFNSMSSYIDLHSVVERYSVVSTA